MLQQTTETITPELTIAEIARTMPQAVEVFEDAGIDYSCRGARSLADAAAGAGYSADELITRVLAVPVNGIPDWYHRPLTELTRYLSADHEETIRTTLKQLREAIDRAAATGCGDEIRRISVLFATYSSSVIAHMLNEERDLFPCIEYLEKAANGNSTGHKPRISQRVLREMVEHETFQEKLRTMRELAWQLTENDAVAALREWLRACSREVHHHIHLENNVLYPRAIALENAVKRAV
jgi:regulator of cell morphogenesis and NO signaling